MAVTYEENGGKGFLRLLADLDSITIYGKNAVDLKVRSNLNTTYPLLKNWILTGIDFSFNVQLKEIHSPDDLKKYYVIKAITF